MQRPVTVTLRWHIFTSSSLTNNDSAEVPAQLLQDLQDSCDSLYDSLVTAYLAKVLGAQDLAPDQEEDADRGEADDPGGDGHHGVGERGEEVQQRLPLLPELGERDAQHDGEHDQTQDVGAVGPLA